MAKYIVFALFGKSASGKDMIQKWIVKNIAGAHGIVSCTTRPPRDNEVDGIDYHFLSLKEFGDKIVDGTMLETTEFRDWFYGTSLDSLSEEGFNVGVFNINGIRNLLDTPEIELYPIYVKASDKTRLLRSLHREKNPDCKEICRRYNADEKDFLDFEAYPFDHVILENETAFNSAKKHTLKTYIGQKIAKH